MSDRYIEKTFLYLIFLSVLLHVVLFTVFVHVLPERKPPPREPQMIDLSDLTELPPAAPKKGKEAKRYAQKRQRVSKETAPKGETELGRDLATPRRVIPPVVRLPQGRPAPRYVPPRPSVGKVEPRSVPRPSLPESGTSVPEGPRAPVASAPRDEGLFKPRGEREPRKDIAKLFPSARNMATLEERYRKKYGPEVEEGDTRFLDTDDILFGSFLHRFENAVYGVWHYPLAAQERGEQGVTPVKITFNRQGQIEKVQLLESSGSKILDDEVLRTLRMVGPVGSFPKGYDRDTFNLIAFFHYAISGSRLR